MKFIEWWFKKVPTLFNFTLELPFIHIRTSILHQLYEQEVFMYYRIYVVIWKYKFDFSIGKRY
jgi:hypothetical protein